MQCIQLQGQIEEAQWDVEDARHSGEAAERNVTKMKTDWQASDNESAAIILGLQSQLSEFRREHLEVEAKFEANLGQGQLRYARLQREYAQSCSLLEQSQKEASSAQREGLSTCNELST